MERDTTWHKERRDRRDASYCERREGLPRSFTLKSPTNTNWEVKGGSAESRLVRESRSYEDAAGW